MIRTFQNYAVIDWSGQNVARPKGLAVAHAIQGSRAPIVLRPTGGWNRETITQWMLDHAAVGTDIIVGLDLSPALPFVDKGAYFPDWSRSPSSAKELWALVDQLSAASPHLSAQRFLDDPAAREHFRHQNYCGTAFGVGRGRLRICEHEQATMGMNPSSCMNLIGAAQVGKSSLTGMRALHHLKGKIPVWPFDPVPETGPLIVEIYTSIAAREAGIRRGLSKVRDAQSLDAVLGALDTEPHHLLAHYDDHTTDAILTTAWLRATAGRTDLWHPARLTPEIARTEGWTFGVP